MFFHGFPPDFLPKSSQTPGEGGQGTPREGGQGTPREGHHHAVRRSSGPYRHGRPTTSAAGACRPAAAGVRHAAAGAPGVARGAGAAAATAGVSATGGGAVHHGVCDLVRREKLVQ